MQLGLRVMVVIDPCWLVGCSLAKTSQGRDTKKQNSIMIYVAMRSLKSIINY